MKRVLFLLLLALTLNCTSISLTTKCDEGGLGYSHMVNFNEVDRYAERCLYSYASNDSIKERYQNVYIKTLKETDIKYFIDTDDMFKTQWITIRGTANFKNFIEDMQYRKVFNEKLGIWVHKGFNESGMGVYNDIIKNKLIEPGYTIKVNGHSLGGGASLILYLSLLSDSANLGMLYTFGQPMITNKEGLNKYRCINLLRFVNEDDLVPHVPPTDFAIGPISTMVLRRRGRYRHVGDQCLLLKDSNYVYLEYTQAERKKISSFWRSLHRGDLSLADHKMPMYIKHIRGKKDVITERKWKDRNKYED